VGRHARPSPLACAAMQAILTAAPGSPATTDEIIAATGRMPLRVCAALARLMLSGWIDPDRTDRDCVWRPAHAPCWYEARINAATAGERN
jgi:hypothetical protein